VVGEEEPVAAFVSPGKDGAPAIDLQEDLALEPAAYEAQPLAGADLLVLQTVVWRPGKRCVLDRICRMLTSKGVVLFDPLYEDVRKVSHIPTFFVPLSNRSGASACVSCSGSLSSIAWALARMGSRTVLILRSRPPAYTGRFDPLPHLQQHE
jgi:hypothetical protein